MLIAYDSSHWIHFVIYALVAVIPVVAWRKRANIMFSLAMPVLGATSELLQALIPGIVGRSQYGIADLFGVAAGILLGANIRMTYSSAKGAFTEDNRMLGTMSSRTKSHASED
jgi:hypothetical protein